MTSFHQFSALAASRNEGLHPKLRALLERAAASAFVKRFQARGIKVPQIGWNELDLTPHPLWRGLPAHPHVYFVHSYFPEPSDPAVVVARSTYGETFASSV